MSENTQSIDRSSLRDINGVVLDPSLPKEERMKSFVEQIGNPYCYLDDGVVVQIAYADTQVSLQERLDTYVCFISAGNLLPKM